MSARYLCHYAADTTHPQKQKRIRLLIHMLEHCFRPLLSVRLARLLCGASSHLEIRGATYKISQHNVNIMRYLPAR